MAVGAAASIPSFTQAKLRFAQWSHTSASCACRYDAPVLTGFTSLPFGKTCSSAMMPRGPEVRRASCCPSDAQRSDAANRLKGVILVSWCPPEDMHWCQQYQCHGVQLTRPSLANLADQSATASRQRRCVTLTAVRTLLYVLGYARALGLVERSFEAARRAADSDRCEVRTLP